MKVIETSYAGCRFRSRLEARWAVFFDTLDIPWQYEPEGFELPSGRYLPDFWLPSLRSWFEVKGQHYTDHEFNLLHELAGTTDSRALLAWGDIPNAPDLSGRDHASDRNFRGIVTAVSHDDGVGGDFDYAWCDFDYAWCVSCCDCAVPGIEYEARGGRVRCERCDPWCVGCCDCAVPGIEYEARGGRVCERCGPCRSDKHYSGNHPKILAAYMAARSARFEHGDKPR